MHIQQCRLREDVAFRALDETRRKAEEQQRKEATLSAITMDACAVYPPTPSMVRCVCAFVPPSSLVVRAFFGRRSFFPAFTGKCVCASRPSLDGSLGAEGIA